MLYYRHVIIYLNCLDVLTEAAVCKSLYRAEDGRLKLRTAKALTEASPVIVPSLLESA